MEIVKVVVKGCRHSIKQLFCKHKYIMIHEDKKEHGYLCIHCDKYIWVLLWNNAKDNQ